MINSVSFKASYVKHTNITKKGCKGEIDEPYTVSLVKLDKKSQSDIQAIDDLDTLWGDKTDYLSAIALYFSGFENARKDFYILTEQKKNFKELNINEILGITQITKNKQYTNVDYLQTNPNHMHGTRNRKYKNIGITLLGCIERLKDVKTVQLESEHSKIKFYLKCGYKILQDGYNPLMAKNVK